MRPPPLSPDDARIENERLRAELRKAQQLNAELKRGEVFLLKKVELMSHHASQLTLRIQQITSKQTPERKLYCDVVALNGRIEVLEARIIGLQGDHSRENIRHKQEIWDLGNEIEVLEAQIANCASQTSQLNRLNFDQELEIFRLDEELKKIKNKLLAEVVVQSAVNSALLSSIGLFKVDQATPATQTEPVIIDVNTL